MRSPAVLLALVDTLAIFYRLRILGNTYRRKLAHHAYADPGLPAAGQPGRADRAAPRVPRRKVDTAGHEHSRGPRGALRRADGRWSPFSSATRTAANWLAASISFLSDPRIAAVVTPRLAPAQG